MMKNTFLCSIYFLFLFPLIIHGQESELEWSNEKRNLQIENIADSTTWDMDRMKKDIDPGPFGNPGFMKFGAFPVPDYSLLGENSFKGLSNYSTGFQPLNLNGKKIVYSSFIVNEGPFYQTANKKDKVFFTLVTVTDTVDLETYTTHRTQILSRNHPDYVGQGFLKTKQSVIDFLAFITPEKDSYALVNMRLFNLNFGNIVIIAPQKDGSFRSIQLKEKELSSDTLNDFIQTDLLKRKEIVDFLCNDDVI
jgi:hypothetical protein